MDPVSQINFFAWDKKKHNWLVPEIICNYNHNNWRGPVKNGQLCGQEIKEKRKTKKNVPNTEMKISVESLNMETFHFHQGI